MDMFPGRTGRATVENQKNAEARLPELKNIPAAVRFISAEPLLGSLEISEWLGSTINWAITGGESGPKVGRLGAWSGRELIYDSCRLALSTDI